eukprot:jgi/Bigna1/86663/estExt_fgenesh1_pg.C_120175
MPKNLLGASESLQGGGKGDFPILAGGSSEGRDGVRFTPLLEHKEEEELRKHMLIRNERRDSFTNASFTNADINDCIDWQFMRTALANERTFLAWVRTSLTLFSFGYGILKVESYLHKDELPWYDHVVAYVFTFAAICAFGIGCLRQMTSAPMQIPSKDTPLSNFTLNISGSEKYSQGCGSSGTEEHLDEVVHDTTNFRSVFRTS